MEKLYICAAIGGVCAIIYAILKTRWVFRQPVDHPSLKRIGGYVAEGAMAFLVREYKVLIPFVLVVAAFLGLANQGTLRYQAFSFLLGAGCSALAGFIGMKVATGANSRTSHAAQSGINAALRVSFTGGSVMGMSVVGLALLGLFVVLQVAMMLIGDSVSQLSGQILPIVSGFSLGASSIALFARVGGGIFTKAADVGADLVGKVEAGIPEDDHRNPATIADNVGDNVGDVAGMGADLFESYVGSLVGCMILGLAVEGSDELKLRLMGLPLLLCMIGVFCSILGTFLVRAKPGKSPQKALNTGLFGAAILAAVIAFPVIHFVMGGERLDNGAGANQIFLTMLAGLIAGALIGLLTELFTGTNTPPVNVIVKSCETGAATNLISGMGMGMLSCFPPIIVIAAADRKSVV